MVMVAYDDKSDDEMHRASLQHIEVVLSSREALPLTCSRWQNIK